MTTTNLISKIGNTPLIYLKKASEISGCKIYGKAEFLNPGESVKDRAALYILGVAERFTFFDNSAIGISASS
jgi:cysteine synthase A